jgi:hypothetical protein
MRGGGDSSLREKEKREGKKANFIVDETPPN